MLLACAAAAFLATMPQERDQGYVRALQLVEQGDLVGALAAADLEEDQNQRARARTIVLYRGRDHLGALSAARAGLEGTPDDAFLVERAAAACLALRSSEDAAYYAGRLAELAAVEEDVELGRGWSETARRYGEWAEGLRAGEERRRRAVGRARSISLAVLLVCATGVLALTRAQR